MPLSTHRIIKRRGKLTLVENGNPSTGIVYSVRDGRGSIWTGGDLDEAERRFEEATGHHHG